MHSRATHSRRVVTAFPPSHRYLKPEMPSQLESYVPQVITAFINSRMELVSALLRSNDADVDDPLEDDEQVCTRPAVCLPLLREIT